MSDDVMDGLVRARPDGPGRRSVITPSLSSAFTVTKSGRMSTGGMSEVEAARRNEKITRLSARTQAVCASKKRQRTPPVTPGPQTRTEAEERQLNTLKKQVVRKLFENCNITNSGYVSTNVDIYRRRLPCVRSGSVRARVVRLGQMRKPQLYRKPSLCDHCGHLICIDPLPMKLQNGQPTDSGSEESVGSGPVPPRTVPDDVFLHLLDKCDPVSLLYFERKPFNKVVQKRLKWPHWHWQHVHHLAVAYVNCTSRDDFDYLDELLLFDRIDTHPLQAAGAVFYNELCVPRHYRATMLDKFLSRIRKLTNIDLDFGLNADTNQITALIKKFTSRKTPGLDEEQNTRIRLGGQPTLELWKFRVKGPLRAIIATTPLIQQCARTMEDITFEATSWGSTDFVKKNLEAFGTALLQLKKLRSFKLLGNSLGPLNFEAMVNQLLVQSTSLQKLQLTCMVLDGLIGSGILNTNRTMTHFSSAVGDARATGATPHPVQHQRNFSLNFLTGDLGQNLVELNAFLLVADALRILPRLPVLQSCSILVFSGRRLRLFVRSLNGAVSVTNQTSRFYVQVLFDTLYTRLVDLQRRLQYFCQDQNFSPKHCDRLNCRAATMHFETSNAIRTHTFCVTEPVAVKDDLKLYVANLEAEKLVENEDSDYESYPEVPSSPPAKRLRISSDKLSGTVRSTSSQKGNSDHFESAMSQETNGTGRPTLVGSQVSGALRASTAQSQSMPNSDQSITQPSTSGSDKQPVQRHRIAGRVLSLKNRCIRQRPTIWRLLAARAKAKQSSTAADID